VPSFFIASFVLLPGGNGWPGHVLRTRLFDLGPLKETSPEPEGFKESRSRWALVHAGRAMTKNMEGAIKDPLACAGSRPFFQWSHCASSKRASSRTR